MDKLRRKEILNKLAEKNLSDFRRDLPFDEKIFPKLFDFIEQKLSNEVCQNDFTNASKFCDKYHIDKQVLFGWLNEQGQACDCEILNLEDMFQYLDIPISKPLIKTLTKKQKLISLKTDYNFYIEKVPSPWILTETILNDKPVYTFQIGKGSDCIVCLETSYPTNQFNNDQYWLDLWINETELNYNLETLIVERGALDNYSCIIVKSKDWTPVLYWIKNNFTDKWFLRMRTSSSRYKGDFKEISKLLNSIRVDRQ